MQRALDEVHPGEGVLFARSGWTGAQRMGVTWGGDQLSDFWSLRALVAATLTAAASGYSNWSHDVGGYCWAGERLVPYVRAAAAAATAARYGLPVIRPLCLVDPSDPRGWEIADAYLFGPSLWVAPVLEEGARAREVPLPRGDWIDFWTGAPACGGETVVAEAPARADPGVRTLRLDPGRVSARDRRGGAGRRARGPAAAFDLAVGAAGMRRNRRAAGRRDPDSVARRRLVDLARARGPLCRKLVVKNR